MIYKVRVILNAEDDVFRDIEIKSNQTLGKLHSAIKSAFSLQGEEMASFFYSDENWSQGEEIPLEDMTEDGSGETMFDLFMKEAMKEKGSRLLYVYDFMKMWTFYVEALEINDKKATLNYPLTIFRFGKMPLKVPSKTSKPVDSLFDDEEDDDFEKDEFSDDLLDDSFLENIDDISDDI